VLIFAENGRVKPKKKEEKVEVIAKSEDKAQDGG